MKMRCRKRRLNAAVGHDWYGRRMRALTGRHLDSFGQFSVAALLCAVRMKGFADAVEVFRTQLGVAYLCAAGAGECCKVQN